MQDARVRVEFVCGTDTKRTNKLGISYGVLRTLLVNCAARRVVDDSVHFDDLGVFFFFSFFFFSIGNLGKLTSTHLDSVDSMLRGKKEVLEEGPFRLMKAHSVGIARFLFWSTSLYTIKSKQGAMS